MSSERAANESRFVESWPASQATPWLLVWRLVSASGRLACVWIERLRQRGDLAELDPYLLRDIGVTQEQARTECRKAFWVD